jgi:A/G-specific adenine glycosylase
MSQKKSSHSLFTRQLTDWHKFENNRELPWKSEKDPYKIWLSEIILQQTRALQGLPYYLRFTAAYPTIIDMAAAPDEEVFRLWQGLGYYNRCRNMLATARFIATTLHGQFPSTYDQILQLKGVGAYTAAAIASFAFNLPHAVVDGNVYRVLSRVFRIDLPSDSTEGKKFFAAKAQELLDPNDSAGYNQAIMDLGATVCTPARPACTQCPLQALCIAHREGITDLLPVKTKKIQVKKRFFHYLLLQYENELWIEQRTAKDIWQSLHQPLLIESDAPLDIKEVAIHPTVATAGLNFESLTFAGQSTQKLTHQIIEARFCNLTFSTRPQVPDSNGKWMNKETLKKTAFPRTVLSFLENNLYF